VNTQLNDRKSHLETGCCGGPAPEGVSACCEEDAEAKAVGKGGCGCGSASTGGHASAHCCAEDSQAAHVQGGNIDSQVEHDNIRRAVRARYRQVVESDRCGCGTTGSAYCGSVDADLDTLSHALGYSSSEAGSVPAGANMGLGCGNPQAIASLQPGETVVDLGSGGGFDCFLASRQVGEIGRVIGVDMTPAMVSKARANAVKGRYRNVEIRLGEIESLPIADATADAIISNCVINLSPDKRRVFAESYRVLKPGGRLAIADIVAFAEPPEEVRRDMALFTGCMAGASLVVEVEAMLRTTGFQDIRVSPKGESRSFIRDWAPNTAITDYVVSATRAALEGLAVQRGGVEWRGLLPVRRRDIVTRLPRRPRGHGSEVPPGIQPIVRANVCRARGADGGHPWTRRDRQRRLSGGPDEPRAAPDTGRNYRCCNDVVAGAARAGVRGRWASSDTFAGAPATRSQGDAKWR
jgi:SAM-dependent methyltransferase